MDSTHAQRAISGLVKLALNLRLFALFLTVLWLPSASPERLSMLTLLLATVGVTSMLPILLWDRVAPFVLAHPSTIVPDLVVSVVVLGLVGLDTPFGLFVLSTALVAGTLYGWAGAGVMAVALLGAYAGGALLGQQTPTAAELFGTPLLVPAAAAGGAAIRGLLVRHHETAATLAESAMQAAAAGERTRLAREMHDTLAKTLHGLALSASALPRLVEDDPAGAATVADRLSVTAERASAEARALIVDLRTDDLERPLGQALAEVVQTWELRTGVTVETDLEDCDGLSPSVRYELFCIAREALRNAHQHGAARHVHIALHDGDRVVLTIRDDGSGFAVPTDLADLSHGGHFGVIGMRERAEVVGGRLRVASTPGTGTTVEAVVPRAAPGEPEGQLPPGRGLEGVS